MTLLDDMLQAEMKSRALELGSDLSAPGGLGTGDAGRGLMPTDPMAIKNRRIGMNPEQYLGEGLLAPPVDRQALKTRTDANGIPQPAYKQRGPLMGE